MSALVAELVVEVVGEPSTQRRLFEDVMGRLGVKFGPDLPVVQGGLSSIDFACRGLAVLSPHDPGFETVEAVLCGLVERRSPLITVVLELERGKWRGWRRPSLARLLDPFVAAQLVGTDRDVVAALSRLRPEDLAALQDQLRSLRFTQDGRPAAAPVLYLRLSVSESDAPSRPQDAALWVEGRYEPLVVGGAHTLPRPVTDAGTLWVAVRDVLHLAGGRVLAPADLVLLVEAEVDHVVSAWEWEPTPGRGRRAQPGPCACEQVRGVTWWPTVADGDRAMGTAGPERVDRPGPQGNARLFDGADLNQALASFGNLPADVLCVFCDHALVASGDGRSDVCAAHDRHALTVLLWPGAAAEHLDRLFSQTSGLTLPELLESLRDASRGATPRPLVLWTDRRLLPRNAESTR